jgi:hypothetical protein
MNSFPIMMILRKLIELKVDENREGTRINTKSNWIGKLVAAHGYIRGKN